MFYLSGRFGSVSIERFGKIGLRRMRKDCHPGLELGSHLDPETSSG